MPRKILTYDAITGTTCGCVPVVTNSDKHSSPESECPWPRAALASGRLVEYARRRYCRNGSFPCSQLYMRRPLRRPVISGYDLLDVSRVATYPD